MYLNYLGFACIEPNNKMLEDVARFLECLSYYSHAMTRFSKEGTSRTFVVANDSCLGGNKKNIIINRNDNNSHYSINMNHIIKRYFSGIKIIKISKFYGPHIYTNGRDLSHSRIANSFLPCCSAVS